MSLTPISLRVVASADAKAFTPSGRLERLKELKAVAYEGIVRSMRLWGLAGQPGQGHTPFQELLDIYDTQVSRIEWHYQNQIAKLCRQFENVLATDAFADPDARKAVIATIRAHSPKKVENLNDPRLFSRTEHDLIACYRRLNGTDRTMVRLLLQRLGTPLTTDDVCESAE
jgi:hypothetical protein